MNPKFGVWMHLWMVICHVPLLGHWELDICPSSYNNRVRSIYFILFELGSPNLVCGCILELQSVMYQVLGHCDLDLFF